MNWIKDAYRGAEHAARTVTGLVRDPARLTPLVSALVQDTRYALRAIRAMPGFALAVILTMGLGIAGTTVIVSAVNAVFMRHLAVRNPEQLVVVEERWSAGSSSTWMGLAAYSYERYLEYRRAGQSVFADVGAFHIDAVSVRTRADDEARVRGATIASSNYFRLLGIRPALGRFFSEGQDGGEPLDPETVISFERWQLDYGGMPGAIGQTVIIDGRTYTIIGVAPREFVGTMNGLVSHFWIPAAVYRLPTNSTAGAVTQRSLDVTVFGRLRPTVSPAQGQAALSPIVANLPRRGADSKLVWLHLDPLDSVPAMGRVLVLAFIAMLSVTAALVTAVAATNVAAMLLMRATHRRREIAVRLALGASRVRVVAQLLIETLILTIMGAVAGIAMARATIALLPAIHAPVAVDVRLDLSLDMKVLAIVILVACAAGIAAGSAPAWQAARDDIVVGLRIGGTTEPVRRRRLRRGFVITQVAMSLVLLFTAGLFVRALRTALETDPGFDATNVVVASINMAPHGYDRAASQLLYSRLMGRLRARPEMEAVSFGHHLPLSGSYMGAGIASADGDPRQRRVINYGSADQEYFRTMRIPILSGVQFSENDDDRVAPIMIVNQTFARTFWPNEPALGKTLTIAGIERTVIGVSRDGKVQTLNEPSRSFAYFPAAQERELAITIYARARVDPSAALAALRSEMRALDPDLAIEQPSTLNAQLDVFRLPQRLAAWLIGGFGIVGLLVASTGLFGVLAFDVAQRAKEFGVRLALGATPANLFRDVLLKAMQIVASGAVFGLLASLAIGTAAQSLFFGIRPADPVVLVVVPALLAVAAFVASLIPAWNAARVDPIVSLRAE